MFIPAAGGQRVGSLAIALSEARDSGALSLTGNTWTATSLMPRGMLLRTSLFSPLGNDIRAELMDAETIVDVLGLAPGLTMDSLTTLLERMETSGDVQLQLEQLEQMGVILASVDPRGSQRLRLRIRDAIDGVLVPQTISVLRRRRLTAAIVDVLAEVAPMDLAHGELIALADHSISIGAPVPSEIFTRAAKASLGTPDSQATLRIAAGAVEAGGGFDAEMALAAAEAQASFAGAALARLARIANEASDDVQRAEALQALVRHVRTSAAKPIEIIDGITLGQLALPDARRDMLKGLMLYDLGDPVAALDLIEPTLPELTGVELAEAWFHVGSVCLILGRVTRASAALDEAEAAYTAAGVDAAQVHMVRANANVLSGKAAESLSAVRMFRDMAASFGQPIAQGMCGWAIGNLLVATGRIQDAIDEYQETIRILEAAKLARTLSLVQLDLALALALSGDAGTAQETMPWESPESNGAGPGVTGKFFEVQGWIYAAGAQFGDARAAFIRSADTQAAGGFLLPAVAALVDAARMSDAGALLSRIEALAVGMDGTYVEILLGFARALAARDSIDRTDAQAAGSLAELFDNLGSAASLIDLPILAAESFHHAAGLHRDAHEERSAAASARLRDTNISACGLRRLPLVDGATSSPLSGREFELASFAAAGLTNREIADRLVLSVRTVETHLQRVYRKLGVRGRSEIPEALGITLKAPRDA
jgi:DNA-binding CsgD family transcriptional regulator/tetratricopeptide (TPR) repeat protein